MSAASPRRVLVTGGRRGLGAALARHFLELGDEVATCATGEMPVLHPERHRHYVTDVSSPADIERLYDQIRANGGLDILINNAGIASMNAIALTPTEVVQRILRVNTEGTILMSRAFVRLLRKSPHGRIVNLTTVAVPLRLAGEAVYAASKGAVETFTRVAAKEFGQFGVTCNAIGPTPVRTELIQGIPSAKLQKLIDQQAISRWATPEDVINVVDFFCSSGSSMITGQVLYLGGMG